MTATRPRSGAALACATVLLASPAGLAAGTVEQGDAAAPGHSPAGRGGYVETVRAERVVLPILLDARRDSPGACADLSAADLIVTEDGAPVVAVERIERDDRPTVHAIAVDVSGSMDAKLPETRAAAHGYIDRLRPGERAMILSFDDSLILHSPLTGDRERLHAAVERIRGGRSTLMWDALEQIVRQLAVRPERKVVVLLTDGRDTLSLHPFSEVADRAASLPSLSVFPIAVDLQKRRYGGTSPRAQLAGLARRTGGRFFDVMSPGYLPKVFRSIRDRLEREAFLVYEPLPFGRGPKDPPRDSGRRRQRVVSVEIAGERTGCRVTVPKRRRTTGAPDAPGAPLPAAPPAPSSPLTLPERWRDARVVSRDPACHGEPHVRRAETGGLAGCTLDVAREWGPRFYGSNGPMGPPATFRLRPFRVEAHVGDGLSEERAGGDSLARPERPVSSLPEDPAELVARWIVSVGANGTDGAENADSLDDEAFVDAHARLLNGQTFLAIREDLARALFAHEDGLRDWLLGELRADAEASFRTWERDVFAPLAIGGGWPDGVGDEVDFESDAEFDSDADDAPFALEVEPDAVPLESLRALKRESLLARAARPTASDLADRLGAWLGDVTAADLAFDVERVAIDRLLSARDDPDAAGAFADRVLAGWPRLREWFPADDTPRLVTPLFPGRTPDGEQVGFWRVVTPRGLAPPASWKRAFRVNDDGLADEIPERPLGLWLVMYLLRTDPESNLLAGGWTAVRVRHGRAPRRLARSRLADLPDQPPRPRAGTLHRVEVTLKAPGQGDDPGGGPGRVLDALVAVEGGKHVSPPRLLHLE